MGADKTLLGARSPRSSPPVISRAPAVPKHAHVDWHSSKLKGLSSLICWSLLVLPWSQSSYKGEFSVWMHGGAPHCHGGIDRLPAQQPGLVGGRGRFSKSNQAREPRREPDGHDLSAALCISQRVMVGLSVDGAQQTAAIHLHSAGDFLNTIAFLLGFASIHSRQQQTQPSTIKMSLF